MYNKKGSMIKRKKGERKMILISGLVNVETNLKVKGFPIPYFPIDYPFFKITTDVSGVAMNIAKGLMKLGDEVNILSFLGQDEEGDRICRVLEREGLDSTYIQRNLKATPTSIILYDTEGKRQVYCDLKDIQDQVYDPNQAEILLKQCEAVILCNINFNKQLLKAAKKMKKLIATDVHVIHDIYDGFNKPFMMYSDLLFLSDENLPYEAERFIRELAALYHNKIIVLGRGSKGAMLYVKDEDKIYELSSVKVREIVNTVGAGDALFSAFVHYYTKGDHPVAALKKAQIFAAYKIGESGGAKGFADEKQVEALLAQVKFVETIR